MLRRFRDRFTVSPRKVPQDGDYGWWVAGILSESCSIFALLHTTTH